MKRMIYLMSVVGLVASAWSASAQQVTKFEWEGAGSPISFNGVNKDCDFTADRSMSHNGDYGDADLGWTFSNGRAHWLADSWAAPGVSGEFVFAGTGVRFRALKYANGDKSVDWKLEGANGQIVKSGSVDLSGGPADTDVEVAAPGELSSGLYKLVIEAGSGGVGNLILLDYAEVIDNRIARIEETNTKVKYSAGWVQGDTFGAPSGGTQAVALTPGEWLEVEFQGTSIGVVAPFNPNMGKFDWVIDGGAGGSGTVDTAQERFAPAAWTDTRVSSILANGLAAGTHTLKLTVAEGNTKNVYIDAFDTNGIFVPVELSQFSAE